jgi:hypothetical protein
MTDIWQTMEEDAISSSEFYRPVAGKINRVRMITDPIRGMTNFKTGDQKVQYQFVVTGDDPKSPLIWGVSAKGAQQQLVSIMKANKLTTIIGAVLQIAVSGEGTERKYTIIPVELPTPANIAQVQNDFPKAILEKIFPKLFVPTAPVSQ